MVSDAFVLDASVTAAWCFADAKTRRGRVVVPDPDFAAKQFFTLCQTRLVLRQTLALLDAPEPGEVEFVVDTAVAMFLRFYAEGRR